MHFLKLGFKTVDEHVLFEGVRNRIFKIEDLAGALGQMRMWDLDTFFKHKKAP
ncbi:hypothetical protein [Lysinibacillus fusiformis]